MRNAATVGARGQDGTDLQGRWIAFLASARAQAGVMRARLDRTTRRERLLLGGLALATFLYAPVASLDWRTQQEDAYLEATTDRSSARLTLAAARRVEADPTGQAAFDDMNSWGFEAANIAVARVRIEQRLVEAATAANLANARITTDEEAEAEGALQWLGAQVQADLSWRGVFGVLDAVSAWPEGFRVTSFSYRLPPPSQNPNMVVTDPGSVTLGLAFPVEISGPEARS